MNTLEGARAPDVSFQPRRPALAGGRVMRFTVPRFAILNERKGERHAGATAA